MRFTTNKTFLAVGAAVAVAALAWLAFGFFGIQSAFIDEEVDEAGPVFTATEAEQDETAATDEFQSAMAEAEENRTEADEPMPDMPADDTGGADGADAADGADGGETEGSGEDGADEIVTLVSGQFSGESRYDIVGEALVLNDGSEERFLRFENFESDNGPDLKVYLRAENGDFVSLGDLKGNIGNQNYEIPVDVDLSVFDTVEIWCERFGVGFGSATLV